MVPNIWYAPLLIYTLLGSSLVITGFVWLPWRYHDPSRWQWYPCGRRLWHNGRRCWSLMALIALHFRYLYLSEGFYFRNVYFIASGCALSLFFLPPTKSCFIYVSFFSLPLFFCFSLDHLVLLCLRSCLSTPTHYFFLFMYFLSVTILELTIITQPVVRSLSYTTHNTPDM